MWYQHMLPSMETDLLGSDVMGAALQPLFFMIEESTDDEYGNILFPVLRNLMSIPRSVQVMQLHATSDNFTRMLFNGFYFKGSQVFQDKEQLFFGSCYTMQVKWTILLE